MKAREQKKSQQREYEKQQKDRTSRNTYKRIEFMVQKAHAQSTKQEGVKEFIVKAKRMDAQVKSKRKRLEKELEKAKVERVERRVFS